MGAVLNRAIQHETAQYNRAEHGENGWATYQQRPRFGEPQVAGDRNVIGKSEINTRAILTRVGQQPKKAMDFSEAVDWTRDDG